MRMGHLELQGQWYRLPFPQTPKTSTMAQDKRNIRVIAALLLGEGQHEGWAIWNCKGNGTASHSHKPPRRPLWHNRVVLQSVKSIVGDRVPGGLRFEDLSGWAIWNCKGNGTASHSHKPPRRPLWHNRVVLQSVKSIVGDRVPGGLRFEDLSGKVLNRSSVDVSVGARVNKKEALHRKYSATFAYRGWAIWNCKGNGTYRLPFRQTPKTSTMAQDKSGIRVIAALLLGEGQPEGADRERPLRDAPVLPSRLERPLVIVWHSAESSSFIEMKISMNLACHALLRISLPPLPLGHGPAPAAVSSSHCQSSKARHDITGMMMLRLRSPSDDPIKLKLQFCGVR
ncbi:hypothetical protein JKP88DRAFT_247194 [Tribonema minus]|uniref:Uncharacterized protein n=1 Tax=Tribonema minus TaxID=303371 RepID=A0A836CCF6_9STRA|nr:hypothetical protein JKP88DRAFT_247194 [Tribonema minus]